MADVPSFKNSTIQRLISLIFVFGLVVYTAHSVDFRIQFQTNIWVNGKDGYHTYRIPTLVCSNKGTLLAFCEGRKKSAEDTGDIDLLLKRSYDNGKTWTEQVVVYEDGGDEEVTIGNPVPIVEKGSERIHLFFTRNYRQIFYTRSHDDGITWDKPKEFTHILEDFDYPRILIATGPVHGIQTKSGRLVVPVWVCDRTRKERYLNVTLNRMRSGIIFSDDGGESWETGGLVPANIAVMHEATVTERTDGSLLINMRTYNEPYRGESVSTDGGLTWSEPWLNNELPEPTCQASMLKTSDGKFLFLNPANAAKGGTEHRKNLVLKLSNDQGRSWPLAFVINQGFSGYSDLAETPQGSIICIYENGEKIYREKISVAEIKLHE